MRGNLKKVVLTGIFVICATFAAMAQTMSEMSFYGITAAGELVSFKGSKPGKLTGTMKISGIQSGEKILGIDFRPATKMLYGVTNQNRLYTINTATGAATAVGTLSAVPGGSIYGVDFNPVPDRLRVVSDADQNLRINPADAVAVTDKPLTFNAADANNGKNPNVAASAYTNNFAGTKTTTLYNIDSTLDVLLTQNPPNDGVLNTVGKLGVNITANAGFDIVSNDGGNMAFAALQIEGEKNSKLYSINLTDGTAKLIGKIGAKSPLVGLAVSLADAMTK